MTTPAPWIVSTAHEVLAVQGVRVSWVPHGVRHARRIGSITTACGLPAHWFKNFHATPFVAGASETCADCNELFTQRGALPPAGGRVTV
ncbi:hypothetical protein [Nocardioides panacihumi]|uniref:hypothetical protein n=1 Tax=Nocardioides panacihumi TaxID=400774 RepID=UPI0031DD9283